MAVPSAPVAAAATAVVDDGFTTAWADSAGSDSYRLDVSEKSDFSTFVVGYENLEVAYAVRPAISYLAPGTTYYYRVRGFNGDGSSANSNTISVALTAPDALLSSQRVSYFLNSAGDVVQFETVELSHPDFTTSYFFVRNKSDGLTATLETLVSQAFQYCPMSILEGQIGDDLDFSLRIQIMDLGEILADEMDEVADNDGFDTEPTVVYRSFRSDDLTAPLFGPITLKVQNLTFDANGAIFDAIAGNENSQKTGDVYTLERFPMLRASL